MLFKRRTESPYYISRNLTQYGFEFIIVFTDPTLNKAEIQCFQRWVLFFSMKDDMYDSNYYRNNGFTEVYDLPVILDGFWMLSHEPLYVNKNMPYANIYGHVHNNPNYNDYSSHGYCVSVERIGYKPVSFEKIKSDVGVKTQYGSETHSESYGKGLCKT